METSKSLFTASLCTAVGVDCKKPAVAKRICTKGASFEVNCFPYSAKFSPTLYGWFSSEWVHRDVLNIYNIYLHINIMYYVLHSQELSLISTLSKVTSKALFTLFANYLNEFFFLHQHFLGSNTLQYSAITCIFGSNILG